MKKTLTIGICVLAAGFVFTGCGGGDDLVLSPEEQKAAGGIEGLNRAWIGTGKNKILTFSECGHITTKTRTGKIKRDLAC